MNIDYSVLKNDEKAIFEMRSLYKKYGYRQYKMNKFEEYELYSRNKDFLVSDNVITFNDTDGKLMALKPDVTLSIIKNSSESEKTLQKLYYNENVYRVSKASRSFREIMQVGLECIGDIDDYCVYEVIMLAAESLNKISPDFVIDISHMGIVSNIISSMNVSENSAKNLIKCIGEKNVHEIDKICNLEGADGEQLKALIAAYGSVKSVAEKIKEIKNETILPYAESLIKISRMLSDSGYNDRIRIDFSVVNDMNYYNGFVFKGFINGISEGILSGGQYDKLMEKMGKKSGAIGFAVYLDMLERLEDKKREYDVDALILYDENASLKAIGSAVKMLTQNGSTVMVQKSIPEKIKYNKLLRLTERGVEIVENA